MPYNWITNISRGELIKADDIDEIKSLADFINNAAVCGGDNAGDNNTNDTSTRSYDSSEDSPEDSSYRTSNDSETSSDGAIKGECIGY